MHRGLERKADSESRRPFDLGIRRLLERWGFTPLLLLTLGIACDSTDLRLDRNRAAADASSDAVVIDGDAARAGADGGDSDPPSSLLPWVCDDREPEEAPTSLEQCSAIQTQCGSPDFEAGQCCGCGHSKKLHELVEAALVACEPNGWQAPCGTLYVAVREGCVVKTRYTFPHQPPLNDWDACLARGLVGRRFTCAMSSGWRVAFDRSCGGPPG